MIRSMIVILFGLSLPVLGGLWLARRNHDEMDGR
jgi:hypothetical protein